jgi:hypothetical protein
VRQKLRARERRGARPRRSAAYVEVALVYVEVALVFGEVALVFGEVALIFGECRAFLT